MKTFFYSKLTVGFILLLLGTPLYAKWGNYNAKSPDQHGQYLGFPRDYYREVTPDESNALKFIVLNLSSKSLVTIAKIRPELEIAGDCIDQLHPLRFLHMVFSDEEMKVGIRNMRGKPWVWSNFISGLKQSFITEASIGNIKLEHIYSFSESLNVDYRLIKKEIDQKQWENLVNVLIRLVPRESGDTRRYD